MIKEIRIWSIIAVFICTCMAVGFGQPTGFNCNFDRSVCGWTNTFRNENVDDFNWKRGFRSDGKQKGSGTGSDHGGGGGYIYIKSKGRFNRTAKLFSPVMNLETTSCVKFYYFMKGKDIGHLEVLFTPSRTQVDTNKKVLWNLRGHQASQWKAGQVPLPSNTRGYLVFEAFDWGKGRSGNIVLDDFSITTTSSACNTIPSYAKPPADQEATTQQSTTLSVNTTMANSNFTTAFNFTSSTSNTNSTQVPAYNSTTSLMNSTKLIFIKTTNTPDTTNSAPLQNASSTKVSIAPNGNLTTTQLGKTLQVARESASITVPITVSLVTVGVVLLVALLLYLRRRKKHRNMYSDDCSVIMTRMYPEITSEPSIDYRKFN